MGKHYKQHTWSIKCCICGKKEQSRQRHLYGNGSKFAYLGVRKSTSTTSTTQCVCGTCYTLTNRGSLLALPTHLPIWKATRSRQLGLFVTRDVVKGQVIGKFFGKETRTCDRDMSSPYIWSKSNGRVIDAKTSNCVVKYANHYVSGLFNANCKLKNVKGECLLIATKKISAGSEVYYNYGPKYFSNKKEKLTKKKLLSAPEDILWRDCDVTTIVLDE
jgi:hypothetical protein